MHNTEHINEKAGFKEVPLVYEKLLNIMGLRGSI